MSADEDATPVAALLVISRFEQEQLRARVGAIYYEPDGSLRWEGDKKEAMKTFGQSMDITPGGPRAVALDLLSILIDYADGTYKPYEK